MSKSCFFIFKKELISKADFFLYIKNLRGNIIGNNDNAYGVINSGEAAIRIYYNNRKSEFEIFSKEIFELYNFKPSLEITIEPGLDDNTSGLAFDFCIKFSEKYPDIIIYNDLLEYINSKK